MVNTEPWLAKLARLRIDKARGDPAPHKPLLLLVSLELAEQGLLPENLLPLSPKLAFRFQTFWNIVAHRRSQPPDVRLPFHHLQSDSFWSALDENGKPSPDKRLTRYAALDGDFVAFAKDPTLRDKARRILIERYFQPAERIALYTLVGLPVHREKEIVAETTDMTLYSARKQGREARFRLAVEELLSTFLSVDHSLGIKSEVPAWIREERSPFACMSARTVVR
jgi:putative restriction endonuclease